MMLFLTVPGLWAELRLPGIFSDHMVLQRDQPVRIWGWDIPGQEVMVRFAGQSVRTTADELGRWDLQLDPLATQGTGRILIVEGSETRELQDVLVGEVWLCSGQSNMEWPISRSLDPDLERLMADRPQIRLITVPRVGTQQPQETFEGAWERCTAASAATFSAVGYHFGRMLHDALGVPVGLIDNAWGGSAAEAWVRRDRLEADERFAERMAYWRDLEKDYDFDQVLAEWESRHAEWEAQAEAARLAGQPVPDEPRKPRNQMTGQHRPGNLYNGVLHPLIGFGLRGAIWYQGESNASRADTYHDLFSLLIRSWRADWDIGDFSFYWVQLADFRDQAESPGESDWAELREAQTQTLALPRTGEAVIYDNGEAKDIHPKDKQTVARRLLRHALAKDYGFELAADSPRYASHRIEGEKVVLRFTDVGGGLRTHDLPQPLGFTIAGPDGTFVEAQAEILEPDRIVVHSPEVERPVAVRYAWADNPVANVLTAEGLLLTPFRTD